MLSRKIFRIALSAALLLLGSSGWSAELVLVINPPEGLSIEREAALALIRGERRNWEGGIDARVVLPARESEQYEVVADRVFGLSGKAMERQWFRLVFAGQVNPPVYLSGDEAAISHILEHPGALGVMAAGAVPSGTDIMVIPF